MSLRFYYHINLPYWDLTNGLIINLWLHNLLFELRLLTNPEATSICPETLNGNIEILYYIKIPTTCTKIYWIESFRSILEIGKEMSG